MTRFIAALLLLAIAPGLTNAADGTAARPNIVLVMIDDLGWMDLNCQGNKRLDTPHINKLATQGMRFTDAYAAAPVCSPTRAAIMTGMSPARLRLTNHISNRDFTPKGATPLPAKTHKQLSLDYVTIAERLKATGYATGFFGKWHLAGTPRAAGRGIEELYPEHQGFDINLGGCAHGGPPSFFDPYRIHNLPDRRVGEYLPDRLADEAITFIKTHRDGPFFLNLWNYTVHWPMEAPQPLIEKYKQRVGPGIRDARYAAMIEAMDAAIGRIVAAIDELELTKKTLVIFCSDNGGFLGVADNRPLRSGKGFLYEGGIRVPMIVRWPGVATEGTVCSTPVISTDLYPTLLAAAGLKLRDGESPDGESLRPLLAQSGTLKRDSICFHYPNYAWHSQNKLGGAIRAGDFKLIERYQDGSVELYNLADDIGEKNDLAAKMPQKAQQLKQRLDAWLKETGAEMPVHKTSSSS